MTMAPGQSLAATLGMGGGCRIQSAPAVKHALKQQGICRACGRGSRPHSATCSPAASPQLLVAQQRLMTCPTICVPIPLSLARVFWPHPVPNIFLQSSQHRGTTGLCFFRGFACASSANSTPVCSEGCKYLDKRTRMHMSFNMCTKQRFPPLPGYRQLFLPADHGRQLRTPGYDFPLAHVRVSQTVPLQPEHFARICLQWSGGRVAVNLFCTAKSKHGSISGHAPSNHILPPWAYIFLLGNRTPIICSQTW